MTLAWCAFAYQFDAGIIERVDDLLQTVDNGAYNTLAGLHPLDGRKRQAREPRQFPLVYSKQRPAGPHLSSGDHWCI